MIKYVSFLSVAWAYQRHCQIHLPTAQRPGCGALRGALRAGGKLTVHWTQRRRRREKNHAVTTCCPQCSVHVVNNLADLCFRLPGMGHAMRSGGLPENHSLEMFFLPFLFSRQGIARFSNHKCFSVDIDLVWSSVCRESGLSHDVTLAAIRPFLVWIPASAQWSQWSQWSQCPGGNSKTSCPNSSPQVASSWQFWRCDPDWGLDPGSGKERNPMKSPPGISRLNRVRQCGKLLLHIIAYYYNFLVFACSTRIQTPIQLDFVVYNMSQSFGIRLWLTRTHAKVEAKPKTAQIELFSLFSKRFSNKKHNLPSCRDDFSSPSPTAGGSSFTTYTFHRRQRSLRSCSSREGWWSGRSACGGREMSCWIMGRMILK